MSSGDRARFDEGSTHKSFTAAPEGTVPNLDMTCSTKSNDTNIVCTGYTATPTALTFQTTFTNMGRP